MTDEQRQAVAKFVDAYFQLRDVVEADTYSEEMRQLCGVIVEATPDDVDERGRNWDEYYCAAELLRDVACWDERVEEVRGMQEEINVLTEGKNDLVAEKAKYAGIIQDLQKYVKVKDDRQKEYLARILELENTNAVLTSANTELRALNSQIRGKNASLKTQNGELQARVDTLIATAPPTYDELKCKVKHMLFKFHPDRCRGDELATEITKDLVALKNMVEH